MKRRIQDRQPVTEKNMVWQRDSPIGREGGANVEDLRARITQKDIALHQAKADLIESQQETEKVREEAERKGEALKTELDELVQGIATKEAEVEKRDTRIRELEERATTFRIRGDELEEDIERLRKQNIGTVAAKTAEITEFRSVSKQGDGKYLIGFSGPEGNVQITASWQAIRRSFQRLKAIRRKKDEVSQPPPV